MPVTSTNSPSSKRSKGRRRAHEETDYAILGDPYTLSFYQPGFELFGYDFFIDQNMTVWLIEINTNPCLSPDAGFMAAAEQMGLSITDVVQRIIQGVPERKQT